MKDKFNLWLLLTIPLRSVLFLLTGFLLFIVLNSPFNEISRWWTVIISFCNVITIILLLLICRAKKTTYGKFVNYEKRKTSIKIMLIVVIVMLVVGMGSIMLTGFIIYGEIPHFPAMTFQPIPLWIAVANIVVLPLTTTLAEDGIYLGVINQNDSTHTVIVSAFFYALQHIFIPFIPDLNFILYRFFMFLPLAVIMCVWYRKNKNPLPFMTGHFILNLATVVQIVMVSASPEMFEQMGMLS